MSRNKLYTILSATCLLGYSWLAWSYFHNIADATDFGVCMFKQVTTIPCPSCGSTRAIVALIHGNVLQSLSLNPLGIILTIGLVSLPLWISYDLITRKSSLLHAYRKSESLLNRRWIAIPAIVLVLLNWAWNIYKGL